MRFFLLSYCTVIGENDDFKVKIKQNCQWRLVRGFPTRVTAEGYVNNYHAASAPGLPVAEAAAAASLAVAAPQASSETDGDATLPAPSVSSEMLDGTTPVAPPDNTVAVSSVEMMGAAEVDDNTVTVLEGVAVADAEAVEVYYDVEAPALPIIAGYDPETIYIILHSKGAAEYVLYWHYARLAPAPAA